jgi:hypothetical protein
VNSIDNRLAEMQELQEIERIEEEAGLKNQSPVVETPDNMAGSFMSESVYGKLNSPKARRRRAMSKCNVDFANNRTNNDTCVAKASSTRIKHPSIFTASFSNCRQCKLIMIQ